MSRIFISFRGGDEPYGAVLVHVILSGWFGPHNVFRSNASIRPGDDYVTGIMDGLRRCDVLLAVMGPRWLRAADAGGGPRLDDPEDWVHRELATAFAAGKRVIPVLLGGATMPAATDLPPGLARLGRCQYRRLDHRQFNADISLLRADLLALLPDLPAPVPRPPPRPAGDPTGGRILRRATDRPPGMVQ